MQKRSKLGVVLHKAFRDNLKKSLAGASVAVIALAWCLNAGYEWQCVRDPSFAGCQYITVAPLVEVDAIPRG